jgi:trans-aconitate 2-methyltransferase
MPSWDPNQYLSFEAERLRPALDLLARVPLEAPRLAYDLGCGPGNVTRRLARRWPGARVIGVDASPEMLGSARAHAPDLAFEEADLSRWTAPAGADLLFSNAVVQWLPDALGVLTRWLGGLAPGAVMAVQVPRFAGTPAHLAIREATRGGPWRWRGRVGEGPRWTAEPPDLYRALAPLARDLDIWETVYLHALRGREPVLEWVKGTALRPLLDAIEESQREAFLAAVAERLRAAYPAEADGATLFPFRRLFIIACR